MFEKLLERGIEHAFTTTKFFEEYFTSRFT